MKWICLPISALIAFSACDNRAEQTAPPAQSEAEQPAAESASPATSGEPAEPVVIHKIGADGRLRAPDIPIKKIEAPAPTEDLRRPE